MATYVIARMIHGVETGVSGETYPVTVLFCTNLTLIVLGSNQGQSGERPASKALSHGNCQRKRNASFNYDSHIHKNCTYRPKVGDGFVYCLVHHHQSHRQILVMR